MLARAVHASSRRALPSLQRALCSFSAPGISGGNEPLTIQYDNLVRSGLLREDQQQRALASQLEGLRGKLADHAASTESYERALRQWHAQVADVNRLRAASKTVYISLYNHNI